MINIRSVNPANANQQALKIQARAAANQLFAQLKVEKVEGDLTDHATMTLGIEYQSYSISLTPAAFPTSDVYILHGEVSVHLKELEESNWRITGNVTFSVTMKATRNHSQDHGLSSAFEHDWQGVEKYLRDNAEKIALVVAPQIFKLASTIEAGEILIIDNPESIALIFVGL